jgi:xylulose-5-phosphate/fructose-6-phosphate phosphoketolase
LNIGGLKMDEKRLKNIDAHWRASNYLSVGQIYLKENPLLLEPLQMSDIKPRLLGHFGTSPGLNLIYSHLNRLIQDTKAEMIYITGPGHGGPALRANVYLEGTMTEVYPEIDWSITGMRKLMREFSWPKGVPSHVSPPTPGSIHEGGELGYSLVHAFGAVLDNPNLISVCVVGDGESETGPLATSWHSNKFINPSRDGLVLPILHLNGYKISGPTTFGRMNDESIRKFFEGLNYQVYFVKEDDPQIIHKSLWKTLDTAYAKLQAIKAMKGPYHSPIALPLIILRSLKGWTCPKYVDGKKIEGTFRSHQVPIADVIKNKEHLQILEKWMLSYHPNELFDKNGKPNQSVLSIIPEKKLRLGASLYANGGKLLKELKLPNYERYAFKVESPGSEVQEATRELGKFIRDIMEENTNNFRVFCPDETNSNRLNHVFEVTKRMYIGEIKEGDEDLADDGRVMEVLSEHLCQGWLEGYLLTGRHGIFPCYEAFALIIDSMLNQHAKWLKACKELPWRASIASLNYLLTSHAWRQDHNGYSHQGPGFIESVMEKKSSVARIYLPPDANCLLSVADHCFRSKNYVNLIIAGKQPMPQWLDMESAKEHCLKGIANWGWASDKGVDPDIVFCSAGDTPTLELLAAAQLLKKNFPNIKIRVNNVVDLFTLMSKEHHPHGIDEKTFNELFTDDKHVIFAFHGHPSVIHNLIYHRKDPKRFHVHGYIEEGTTTTPFDMVVCNRLSRFHLAMNAVKYISKLKDKIDKFHKEIECKLEEHKNYIFKYGLDMPEIINWKWENVY